LCIFLEKKKEENMMTSLPAPLEHLFTHHTTEVNGVRFHSVIGGQGSPLVLLHGWPQTWYAWRKIMPELAKSYTVIVPDLPGLGDSAPSEAGYDTLTVAEYIFQLIRSLGYQQIFLVGHDLGALVAYAYAVQHREQVQRLVILDVPVEGFGLNEMHPWHFGFFQAPGLAESLVEGRVRLLLQFFFSGMGSPAAFAPEDVDEYVRCYSNPDSLQAGFEYYRAFPRNEQRMKEHGKQKLQMPVLALGGENSGGGFPFYSLAQVAEHVSGGIILKSGHFIPEDQPEELVRQLNAFFSEHDV